MRRVNCNAIAVLTNKLVLFVVALLSSAILLSTQVFADTTITDPVDIIVPASCTFSAGGGSYRTTIVSGNIGTITANDINTSCNDTNGYSVYAIGYSGDTYTGDYHTDMISSLGNTNNIKTNGTSPNSYWKMKLESVVNATITNSYNDYQVIPASFTKVATYTSFSETSTITPSYQVYIGGSQPAGSYSGKVKYVLVHPNTFTAGQYTIAYNANGGSGTMTSSSNIYNFEPFTLPDSTFTAPSGYGFAGWCTVQDQTQNPQTTCSGALYLAGDEVTSLGTANSTVTLYAIWGDPTMQEFATNNTCADMSIGSTKAVVDGRDNTHYLVGKLADGNCWMLDNLALDLTSSTVLNAMDNINTNASSTSLGYLKNGGGTTSDQYATAAVSNWTSSYSYSAPLVNATNKDTVVTHYGAGSGKVGVYYNFCAASAGSYCYGNGTSYGASSGNATEDVCPAGWRMPSFGYSSGEFGTLYSHYNTTTDATSTASLQYNLSTPLSGYFYDGSAGNQGSDGRWWSSTRANNIDVYFLYVDSSNFNTNSIDRNAGNSLRCVTSPKYYMQDMTSSTLASLMPNTGDTATLYDNRDEKAYTVAKLADGKYWMTTNLNLAGGTALSADDTDVDASYISSFTTSNNLTKSGNTIVLPASSPEFNMNNYSFVYNNPSTDCSSATGCYGYYSWDAATLGSGRSISTENTDAPYSICPKGWRLPTSGSPSNNGWKRGDFYALATAYGVNLESSNSENSATFYNNAGPGTTPNFLLAGDCFNGSCVSGSYGRYWSATSYSSTSYARYLHFYSGNVISANYTNRYTGYAVRCLVAG